MWLRVHLICSSTDRTGGVLELAELSEFETKSNANSGF